MSRQETLGAVPFDPLQAGLFDRYTERENGALKIHHTAWLRAHAAGDIVGNCRICNGHLHTLPMTEPHGRPPVATDAGGYEARCIECGQTYLAPRGRVLRRSSRLAERGREGL
jgi:hypothetical protein